MDITAFADKYDLRPKQDGCGESIVPGKQFRRDVPKRLEYRSFIYDGFTDGSLGVCLLFATKKKWAYARKTLEEAGFTIKQNGGSEGCAKFDPTNEKQVSLALKMAGIKPRRKATAPSEAQLAVRAAFTDIRRGALQSVAA